MAGSRQVPGVPGALPLLTGYIWLLLIIPSERTIAAVGSVGRPSILWGLLCLMWWVWVMLTRREAPQRGRQSVRLALFVFLLAVLASYAAASIHGVPANEVSPLDSAIIRLASWTGIVLLANDGLSSISQVEVLMRRIAFVGGLLGLLGLAQYALGDPIINQIQIPGLTFDPTSAGEFRGDIFRADATAIHPLEFAAVLSAALPLAIAVAVYEPRQLRRWWVPVPIVLAAMVSVSRSAFVGVAVGVVALMPALPRLMRRLVVLGGFVLLMVAYLTVPTVINTVRWLFVNVEDDPSAASRTSAVGGALQMASNYSPFGRGFGTLLPDYFILDNQILGLYVEVGVVGLAAFLVLIVTGLTVAFSTAKALHPKPEAILVQSLAAALAGSVVLFLFFDGLSFPMAGGMVFLLLGVIGAARNVRVAGDPDRAVSPS